MLAKFIALDSVIMCFLNLLFLYNPFTTNHKYHALETTNKLPYILCSSKFKCKHV